MLHVANILSASCGHKINYNHKSASDPSCNISCYGSETEPYVRNFTEKLEDYYWT